ncbi:hypothetical protein ACWCPX_05450 [Streptomyces olivaceoviridis]|uniref:hypothetical protein n=1 Tax=Streptomyces olivaceoviridis TaxID=1921 RepID=UPI0033BE431B
MLRIARNGTYGTALSLTAAALLVTSCSSDSDREQAKTSGTTASKICDGALDAPARQALQNLAGTDQFDESTGAASEAGQPRTFSIQNAVKHLHDEYRQRTACWVYKTGDESGKPLLEIRFSASQSYPKASGKESNDSKVRYPVGLYAKVGRDGADLFFQCATGAGSKGAYIGDTKYVKAELYSTGSQLRGNSVDKDRMVILNSISRKVAEEAGCASEADLPTAVPDA